MLNVYPAQPTLADCAAPLCTRSIPRWKRGHTFSFLFTENTQINSLLCDIIFYNVFLQTFVIIKYVLFIQTWHVYLWKYLFCARIKIRSHIAYHSILVIFDVECRRATSTSSGLWQRGRLVMAASQILPMNWMVARCVYGRARIQMAKKII